MAITRYEFQLENGNKFYVRRFDAFLSLKILGEIQKKFLGPLAAVIESRNMNAEAFNMAIDKMSKSLDGDSLVEVAKRLLNPEFVSVSIDNGEPRRLDEGALNLAIDDTYDMAFIIKEVFAHNYQKLFTQGRTLIGTALVDQAIQ